MLSPVVRVLSRNILFLVALAATAISTSCSGVGPALPPATGGAGGSVSGGGEAGSATGGAYGGSPPERGPGSGGGSTAAGGGMGETASGGAAGAGGSDASSSGGTSGAGGSSTSEGGGNGGAVLATGGTTAAGGGGGGAGTGGSMTTGSGGISGTGGTSATGGVSGTGGTSCDPTAGSWQHVISCDVVAPGNIFHSCVDYFATAQSAASVSDRETAACTDQGGTALNDMLCASASSLGSCIATLDAVLTSGAAEYTQAFQYPGLGLTAAIIAEGCAADGLPYLPANSDPSTGVPPFTCP